MASMKSVRKPPLDFAKLYFPSLQREFTNDFLKKHGEFLLRRGGDGSKVLSVNRSGDVLHFKFSGQDKLRVESRTFDTLEAILMYCYETGARLPGRPDVKILAPVVNTVNVIDYAKLEMIQELGRGNFGQVWRARLMPDSANSTMGSEEVAVKVLAESTSDKDRIECMAEAKLMSVLDHENIVKLKGLSFWSEPESNAPPKLLIVLDYCNMGSLDKLLEKDMLGSKGKQRALLDAAKGIEYLHERHIIHRDIASRNCLVQKQETKREKFTVKIGDFGLSRLVENHYKLVTKRRLPIFSTPPDTLKTRDWTAASDVWSFGVLMQEVYNDGKNPYEAYFGNAPLKQIYAELTDGFRVPTPQDMPPDLAQLSLRCMWKEQDRPKMSEVVVELNRFYDRS